MNRMLQLTAAGLVVWLLAGAAELPAAKKKPQVGRYQLRVNYDGTMFLVDTATGQCWTKTRQGDWIDAGNPTKPKPRKQAEPAAATKPLALSLPEDKVELTIKQRRSKAIPGADGRVRIHVDDVTGGQALVSVRTDDGKVLLDDVSCRVGSVEEFTVGKRRFYLSLRELRNFVIGEDFAVVDVAAKRESLELPPVPAEPETPKPATPPESDRLSDCP